MKKQIVQFDFTSGGAQEYDKAWEELKKAGHENPNGLLYHAAGPKDSGGWLVVDVWESREAFDEFSKTLGPIIQKLNLTAAPPVFTPVYNIYEPKEVLTP